MADKEKGVTDMAAYVLTTLLIIAVTCLGLYVAKKERQEKHKKELLSESRTEQLEALKENDITQLDAIVGRGGMLPPVTSGTYLINEKMIDDLKNRPQANHASNLGAPIAFELAKKFNITQSFIVDPVSVDEFEPLARITGVPEISRRSLFHALNLKAIAHRAAKDLQTDYNSMSLIMVHLGGGISVGIQKKGKMIDVSNPNGSGPFSPERCGAIPAVDLVQMCYSGNFTLSEMMSKLVGKAGLVAHLGINDGREIEQRIDRGDAKAALIFEAMAYQIAKEIGAMATVVSGKVDAIVLTGGLAHSKRLVEWIIKRVSFIANVLVYPGEDELQSLAEGALRVLRGEEEAKIYS